MDNQSHEAAQFFAGAFAETLAEALTQASGVSCTIEALDKPNLSARQGAPFHVRLSVDGALRGDCFVEFYRSEVALIASKILGKPDGAFDEERAQAVTKAITSAITGLVASLSPEYGLLTIQVDEATGIGAGAMHIVPLAASCGESGQMSVLLYFSPQLMEAFSPQPVAKPKVEKETPPTEQPNLRLVLDVELNVTLRFGQRTLPLREVLELSSGSVIELDHQVDEPVELLLDGKVVARGEAVIVDGNYGLRVTEVPQPVSSHFAN